MWDSIFSSGQPYKCGSKLFCSEDANAKNGFYAKHKNRRTAKKKAKKKGKKR